MNFKVGEKVVRVDSKQRPWATYGGPSKYGYPAMCEVVTIKTINHWSAITLITFVEYDNSNLTTNGYEPGFDAKCFRRLVKRETDIGIFTKILDDARAKVPEKVE